MLSNRELGDLFIHDHRVHVRLGDTAIDLLDDVEHWLADGGMSHRSAMAVARELARLAPAAPAPLPSPEIAAFEANVAGGYGDAIPDVSSLSMAEYSRVRLQPGMPGAGSDLVSFLGAS